MFECIHEYFEFYADRNPNLPFASDCNRSLNYGEARDEAKRIASRLSSMGIQKGDRVALLAKNSVNQFLTYLGISISGAVPLGLNYRLAPSEWIFILNDSETKCLFCDAEFIEPVQTVSKLPLISFGESQGKATAYNDWLAEKTLDLPRVKISGDDVLFHMYTSGTTGHPKGVLITHNNVITNVFQSVITIGKRPQLGDRTLLVAPLYHCAGLVGTFAGLLFGTSLIIHSDFDPLAFIETIVREKIKSMNLIPVMLQFIMTQIPDIEKYDFSHLETISYGASPISIDLLTRAMDTFSCDFNQGYGQTEATVCLTALTPRDHRLALEEKPERLRSCGRAVIGTEIRIVDDNGNNLPPGKTGEVIARGPQIMKGYWNNPKATKKSIKNGWLYTGDAGYLDEEGYLFLQDRIHDMIISGGENIYPVEIENVLMSHPQIQEAAVIGVPDKKWGEVPLAVLVSNNPETLDLETISHYCRQKLAGFKNPKHIEFVKVLPRNPSGKVLKKELRRLFLGNL